MPDDEGPTRPVQDLKRIVVKVGTHTLCNPDGLPDTELLSSLAADIRALMNEGKKVIVVSSGAIGCGRAALKLHEEPDDIERRQALAAVGQPRLMAHWQDALGRHKVPAAQVLPTHQTFASRRSFTHLKACVEHVLKLGAVPIINENDSVSVREIGPDFGDNHALGGLVASRLGADLYAMLSDVQGLYTEAPHRDGASLVSRVERVTDRVLAMADGGMGAKLRDAARLTERGIHVAVAYGREDDVLTRLLAGAELGTWFDAVARDDDWLRAATPEGQVVVDAGAARAVRAGKNLLPAGVTAVAGEFPVESVIDIVHDGAALARAVSRFGSDDLVRCRGLQTDEARALLGVDGAVSVTVKDLVL